jgi:uridine phosphorylase
VIIAILLGVARAAGPLEPRCKATIYVGVPEAPRGLYTSLTGSWSKPRQQHRATLPHRSPRHDMTGKPPILDHKHPASPSVFEPAALLREARRQKGIDNGTIPPVCLLDPDGDIVRRLRQTGEARSFPGWPCYHTELDTFSLSGQTVGIVGRVVGASFATLVAEELFASGCRLLISLTSAGQITPAGPPPYFVVIDRALRDEGTSYHYAAPSEFAEADPALVAAAAEALARLSLGTVAGASWTTDAPFRETAEAIAAARAKGILAVEMEAAALYTYAKVSGARVLCLAHVTNTMGLAEQDFEKGEGDGTRDALTVLDAVVSALNQARLVNSGGQHPHT